LGSKGEIAPGRYSIMPTLSDLCDDFAGIVHDPTTFDSDRVIALFNKGIVDISEQLLLPALETVTNVLTDPLKNNILLPDDYSRKLTFCNSLTNNRPIKIFGSHPLLFRNFWKIDLAGRVLGVAVRGQYLYYQRIPSTPESLQLTYWAKPSELSEIDYTHEYIPAFGSEILLAYACWKAYGIIEEGMDGIKTQTGFYNGEYNKALGKLAIFLGPEHSPPILIEDELMLDNVAGRPCSGWNGGSWI
jgi:hypothetical protein